jgi:hypothetical protein
MTAKLVLAMVLTGLLAPATGDAFTIGAGSQPGVAVDAAGTAYVAWNQTGGPDPVPLAFCRIPRGATSCTPATLTVPGTVQRAPFVFVNGTRVIVLSYRYGAGVPGFSHLYALTSTDGGATFGQATAVAKIPAANATAGPDDTISVVSAAFQDGTVFENFPVGGASPGEVVLSTARPYQGAVALSLNRPVVLMADGSGNFAVRTSPTGDVTDVSNWTAEEEVGKYNQALLASGSAGLYMFALDDTTSPAYELLVRPWTGATFGGPVDLGTVASPNTIDVTEDPGGYLHAVFGRSETDAFHAKHMQSTDGGVTWTTDDLAPITVGSMGDTRVAVAPDHIGVAVYWGGTGVGDINVLPVPGTSADTPSSTTKAKARITGHGTVRVNRTATATVRISGKIKPSRDIPCGGTITATLFRKHHKLGHKRIAVKADCTWTGKGTLKKKDLGGAGHLNVELAFSGTATINSSSRHHSIKIRRPA